MGKSEGTGAGARHVEDASKEKKSTKRHPENGEEPKSTSEGGITTQPPPNEPPPNNPPPEDSHSEEDSQRPPTEEIGGYLPTTLIAEPLPGASKKYTIFESVPLPSLGGVAILSCAFPRKNAPPVLLGLRLTPGVQDWTAATLVIQADFTQGGKVSQVIVWRGTTPGSIDRMKTLLDLIGVTPDGEDSQKEESGTEETAE